MQPSLSETSLSWLLGFRIRRAVTLGSALYAIVHDAGSVEGCAIYAEVKQLSQEAVVHKHICPKSGRLLLLTRREIFLLRLRVRFHGHRAARRPAIPETVDCRNTKHRLGHTLLAFIYGGGMT